MGTVFDIIGSTLIRGAIMLAMINLTVQMNEALFKKTTLAASRQASVIPAQILYNDLYSAGYGVAYPKTIATAKSNEILFTGIIDTIGTVGTLRYECGSDCKMYRSVNAVRQLIAHDVTQMRFDYYDSNGTSLTPATNLGNVKSIRFRLTFLPQNLPGQARDSAYWEKRVFPPNQNY
ncbi:MAG: hypothetical protein NTV54_04205 [Ignavibacteriales bacterium]|nr:hypothetical protein [Ignavibacteriales bacterium]